MALAVPTFPVDLLRIPGSLMGASVTAFTAQMLSYVVLPFLFLDAYGHTPWRRGIADHDLAAGHRGHRAGGRAPDRAHSRRLAR